MEKADEIRRLAVEIQRYTMVLKTMYALNADPVEIRLVTNAMIEKIKELDQIEENDRNE
jgi:hypothetical protein